MSRLLCVTPLLVLLFCQNAICQEVESFPVPPFGTVRVFRATQDVSRVVILASGEAGWNQEAQHLAEQFAALDSLVVGVNTKAYLGPILAQSNCTYPAADFENLSRFVQQKLRLPGYTPPILAGYGAGASLVYATAVQAPSHVFVGGISIGFCPSAPLTKAVCPGLGVGWNKPGRDILPATGLRTPWVVLQKARNTGCAASADAFLKQMTGIAIVTANGQGEPGSFPEETLLARALQALSVRDETAVSARPDSMKDLPLIEVPATGQPNEAGRDLLAVMISGDGGWAGLDREVGNAIATHGIPMVGFNSLKYFWTPRTPDQAAKDVLEVITHYLKTWDKKRLILIGYSFGADVLPFIYNRLPDAVKAKTDLVVLMGPSTSAQFEFHLSNWLGGASDGALSTLPEAKEMKGRNLVCLYGKGEADSLCPGLDGSLMRVIALPGGHHFDGDYPALARRILTLAGLETGAP